MSSDYQKGIVRYAVSRAREENRLKRASLGFNNPVAFARHRGRVEAFMAVARMAKFIKG